MKRKKSAIPAKRGRLVQQHRVALEAPNASGIAALDNGTLLVADDELGLYATDPSGAARLLLRTKQQSALRDIESICVDRERNRVLVACERGGNVLALPVRVSDGSVRFDDSVEVGRLPLIGKVDNKGWEGISWVADGVLGKGEHLLAVHEGKPRRIGLFTYPDLSEVTTFKVPGSAKDALLDLSDVEVDLARSRILVLSDESRSIVAFSFPTMRDGVSSLDVLGIYDIPVGKGEKPEGLCIVGDRLWVVTDGKPFLYAFEVPGA